MAILDFIKEMNVAIDSNMYTAGIFMDLSQAFDTINYDILLQKLYHYGFRGYPMSGLQVTAQIENKWFHIIQLCPQANQLNVGDLRDLF